MPTNAWTTFSRTTLLLASLALAPAGRADTLITLDGKVIDGDARLLASGDLLLSQKSAAPVQVPLNQILYATLNVSPMASLSADIPGPLASHAIGDADSAGDVFAGRGFYSLRGGGGGITGTADGCRFLSKGFYANGELDARIDDVRGPDAVAGLMFRDEMDANAIEVCLVADAAGKLELRYRAQTGKSTTTLDAGKISFPAWLSLRRAGREFKAYTSADGKSWQMTARIFDDTKEEEPESSPRGVDMDTGSLVGIVLAGSTSEKLGPASTFVEQLSVRGLYDSPTPASKPAALPARYAGALPETRLVGILLRTGTFLAKATVDPTDAGHMTLARGNIHYQLDPRDLAIIRMREAPQTENLPAGTGVLLASGDFMEGDITRLDKEQVEVSNVTLGLSTYPLDSKVSAIFLRPVVATPPGYRIRLTDGSIFAARSMTVQKQGAAVLDDYILGPVTVPADQIYSIQGAADRATRLLTLSPARIEGPADSLVEGISAGDAAEPFWLALPRMNLEDGIVMPAGCAASYRVPAGTKQLLARVGVPERLPAAAGVVFIVQADGKEIYRSATMTSQDAPAAVQVKLEGAKLLRLSVERAGKAELPTFGAWCDAMTVR